MRHAGYWLVLLLGILLGAGAMAFWQASESPPAYDYATTPEHELQASLQQKADYLQRLNVNAEEGLRQDLLTEVALDAELLWQRLQDGAHEDEAARQRTLRLLRLVAVQGEKYPAAKWQNNRQLQHIFEAALSDDPEHAQALRARAWDTPWWSND